MVQKVCFSASCHLAADDSRAALGPLGGTARSSQSGGWRRHDRAAAGAAQLARPYELGGGRPIG